MTRPRTQSSSCRARPPSTRPRSHSPPPLMGDPGPLGPASVVAFGLLSALAWVIGAVALLALYGGVASGRMGVVAPVAGVLGATIPVVAGILLEGLPQPIVLAGIGLAIIAVVLVSRV